MNNKFHKIKPFSLLSLFFIIITNNYSYSETLEDLLNSPVLQGMEQDNKVGSVKANRDKFLDENTNYGSLFLKRDPLMLLDWLNHKDPNFRVIKEYVSQSEELAFAIREYESKEKRPIKLQVLVPHPRYIELSENNLVLDIAKLEPPKLKIKYAEPFQINNQTGKFYHLVDTVTELQFIKGECHSLIKFDKGTRINIISNCNDLEDVKSIISTLTFDRLKEKLNS
jgi:hypothetical protein